MALFKISKGKSNNLPTNKVDGYCYVTTNDHKFYVDYTKDDGTLDRFALNAVYADTAGIAQKLGTINVGNSNKPIYLDKGTPKECVDFLPLSAGQDKKLTGPLGLTENINYGISLPDNGFDGQLFFLEDDSPSLPIGGTAGQVLTKNSSEDGDASWTTDIAGNAATASKLATARTISLTGSITGNGTFDGSDNLSIKTTTNHTHSYLPLSGGTVTGEIHMGTSSTTDGPAIIFPSNKRNYIWMGYANDNGSWYMWDSHNSKGIIASDINGNNTFFGNADTATKLATARKINSVSFNGTADITFAGSYTTATAASSIPNGISFIDLPSTATSTGDPTFGTCLTVSKTNTIRAFQLCVNKNANAYIRAMHTDFTDTTVPGYSEWYQVWRKGNSVTGAVWNDYAECRKSNCEDFGYVLMENGDDTLSKTTERLSHFAGVSSDTWGFSQGETDKAKTPIAVAGRVLVYPYQDRNNYKPGDCVCAAPGGTVDIMTREEVREWPDRIVGTVSCVPNYEEWGGGECADRKPVKVNGRIWIKVR